jgi:hypothetical protein
MFCHHLFLLATIVSSSLPFIPGYVSDPDDPSAESSSTNKITESSVFTLSFLSEDNQPITFAMEVPEAFQLNQKLVQTVRDLNLLAVQVMINNVMTAEDFLKGAELLLELATVLEKDQFVMMNEFQVFGETIFKIVQKAQEEFYQRTRSQIVSFIGAVAENSKEGLSNAALEGKVGEKDNVLGKSNIDNSKEERFLSIS